MARAPCGTRFFVFSVLTSDTFVTLFSLITLAMPVPAAKHRCQALDFRKCMEVSLASGAMVGHAYCPQA